jgi:hypothetical protein
VKIASCELPGARCAVRLHLLVERRCGESTRDLQIFRVAHHPEHFLADRLPCLHYIVERSTGIRLVRELFLLPLRERIVWGRALLPVQAERSSAGFHRHHSNCCRDGGATIAAPAHYQPRLSLTAPFRPRKIPASDRPDHLALPHRGEARRWWHGRGLQG